MMTVGLVGGVLALLLVLEILNALFDSVCEALRQDMKGAIPLWALPFELLRRLLALLATIGNVTSLVTHELAHAAAQLAFGGKPRVAFLKNGGYAQSSPWADAAPLKIVHALGGVAGLGVMCAAPLLVGATLLLVTLVIATPLAAADVVDLGAVLGTLDADAIRGVLAGGWDAIARAPWWGYAILVVVPLLIAPGMTPSSVDYVHGALHLFAYGVGAIVCAEVAARAPHALWTLAAGAAVVGVLGAALANLPEGVRRAIGGLGLGTALIALAMALADAPVAALHAALGTLLFGLGAAAITYVAFVGLFLGLSLISVRPRTLALALAGAPKHLRELVQRFHTCERCRIHYRGTCDGCGRTPEQPALAA